MMCAAFGLSACTQVTTSCVAAGARVLTPTGWKKIEDLSIGDEIISICEESGKSENSAIVAIKQATREVGEFRIDGKILMLTSDHPVFCPESQSYEPAGDWFLGKRTSLFLFSGEELRKEELTSVKSHVGISEVFDLTVQSEHHNFIAEGVLVHNKSPTAVVCKNEQSESVFSGDPCESVSCEGDSGARYTCTDKNGFFSEQNVARCLCPMLPPADMSSCVAAGSNVLAESGLVLIEDLRIGDLIYSVNEESGARELSAIVAIKKSTREVGSVALMGHTLCMTSDHPVYDPETKTYAPAGDWFIGKRTQLALIADGGLLSNHAVEERQLFVKMSDVYDLSVASSFHNFVAEGILVHNKLPDVSYDLVAPDAGSDVSYDVGKDTTLDIAADSDTGNFEPFHEHCGEACDGICTGSDGNLTCVRDSIGCDTIFFDLRDDCDIEFSCNDGLKPKLTCSGDSGNYDCTCESGQTNAEFKLGVCPSPSLLLEEINAHCASRYSIQP